MMNNRPLPVTLIGYLFAGAGAIGLAYHLTELRTQNPSDPVLILVLLLRLLALLCGVFLLFGKNQARWVLLFWMAYHVVLSIFHSALEVVVHSLLLAVIAWFLFRPQASAFFRGRRESDI